MNLLDIFRDSDDLVEFPTGTVLFSEGVSGDHMYVVVEGEVEITLHDRLLANAGPGEMVGEMALINSEIRSATATTTTRCLLARIDRASFDSMLRHVPDFAIHVMSVLTERLQSSFERVD